MWKTYFRKSASSYLFLAIAIASLLLFWFAGFNVISGTLEPSDRVVSSWIGLHRISSFTPVMIAITDFGDASVVIFLLGVVFLFLVYRKVSHKIILVYFCVQTAFSSSALIKSVAAIARPTHSLITTSGFSFPSGHATVATAFFLSALFVLWPEVHLKRSKTLFASLISLMIFLVAFSRIYLEAHWLSDVIGGILLGLGIFSFGVYVYKKIGIMHNFKWNRA